MIGNNYFLFFLFRNIVKQHVGILRWHTPKTEADMKKWEKVLNRGGNFKMSMLTKVCSNHFVAGYCSSECRIPTLFLKGYNVPCRSKRSSPRKRLSETLSFLKSKRSRQVYRTGLDNSDNNIECSVTPPASKEHDYEVDTAESCARLLPSITCQICKEKNTTILELKQELAEEKNKLKDAMKKIEELQDANKRKNRFSIQEVKDSNRLVKFLKRQRNCNISGEIHLLLVRTIKQVKIRKNQGRIHLYPLKTAYF